MLGWFKNEYMVEAYGKLPFYKDYIHLVASVQAGIWQDWLLKTFGQKNTLIPQGIWHFLFFPARNSPLVTGIIMQGSDGRRDFPFSLFVTLGRSTLNSQMKWAELFAIKDELCRIFTTVSRMPDIDSCYHLLSGLSVETRKKTIRSRYLDSVNCPVLKPAVQGKDHEFPCFSIIFQKSISCLSRGEPRGRDLVSKWDALRVTPVNMTN